MVVCELCVCTCIHTSNKGRVCVCVHTHACECMPKILYLNKCACLFMDYKCGEREEKSFPAEEIPHTKPGRVLQFSKDKCILLQVFWELWPAILVEKRKSPWAPILPLQALPKHSDALPEEALCSKCSCDAGRVLTALPGQVLHTHRPV